MPTYQYICSNCGHELEDFQSMSEPHLTHCPNCNQETLLRAMGAGAGVIFKGSGFYLTDYKKSSASPAPSAAPSAGPAPAGEKKTGDAAAPSGKEAQDASARKRESGGTPSAGKGDSGSAPSAGKGDSGSASSPEKK